MEVRVGASRMDGQAALPSLELPGRICSSTLPISILQAPFLFPCSGLTQSLEPGVGVGIRHHDTMIPCGAESNPEHTPALP